MKLFLFADDTIVYLENHEESTTTKILELISAYSKVIEYKELCKQWTTAIFYVQATNNWDLKLNK